jgi:hypothetical protein
MWDAVRNEPRFHQILANIGCEAEYKVGRETLARMLEGPGRQ